ncbi:MAG: hypothetical protein M1819_004945 [Sarea resinae]|nr:MAG: hypothetical protein M1819_004945 [Sarea resinae]
MPGADTASLISQQTSTSGRPLFPKGPTFSLENFSSKDFIVKDFVESLSDSGVPAHRRSNSHTQAFDPKPLIRTFEHALSRLATLSEDLEIHENELSGSVRRAEAQHNQNIEHLGKKLDQTIEAFRDIDSSLNGGLRDPDSPDSGGILAVKIGERLEELDRQRQRAQDAKFLIQCWMEVSERGDLSLLEDVRRSGGGEGKVRCAHIARQLMRISQRLDPESWGQKNSNNGVNGANGHNANARRYNSRELIEQFLETLEKDLLKQFDDFYRRQNLDGMRDCANALHDFHGGASVIGLFVNQHQFFIDRSQLITEEINVDGETWERLADPDAEPQGVEPNLQSLVDEVRVVAQDESFIIKRAFPYYDQVLQRFLQRVFQQSIQQRLETVLEKANTISLLAFLRSLQTARSYLSALVEDLKAHGLTEHPEPISAQTSTILDQQLDDLFVPYFVGSSYIEREKKSLEELYSSLLFKFTIYHSRRRKIPTTFMASLAKSGSELLASARDAYIDRLDSSDLSGAQKSMLSRIAGLKEADNAKNKNEIEVTEQDGVLSVFNAKRMLKWLAEAVGRGLELSGGSETPKDVAALLNLLLANMGEIYVETALDATNDFAASQEASKTEPDISYLPNLRPAVSIMHLMIACINTVLIPLTGSNLTVRREVEKTANLAVNRMEEKVNSIMQRTIDVALGWISRLLTNQKKSDFRPKDLASEGGGAWLEMLQTPTCHSILTFLRKFHEVSVAALDGPNLSSFLTELAIGIRALLLDHFRKFQVNATGGLMVTKDITQYLELLRTWPLAPGFLPHLETVAEIGNLFVIGPEALRERVRGAGGASTGGAAAGGGVGGAGASAGGAAGAVAALDMRPYILRREDVASVGVQSVLAAL